MLKRCSLNVLLMFRSSWLMRSPNSVFGAISGTDNDATFMPGSTSWLTDHVPCATHGLVPVERVVVVMSHTVPTPFCVFSCIAHVLPVAPVGPPSAPECAPMAERL